MERFKKDKNIVRTSSQDKLVFDALAEGQNQNRKNTFS